jgi:hypothetical protein
LGHEGADFFFTNAAVGVGVRVLSRLNKLSFTAEHLNENRSSTPVLQFMSLDGVGNWKAGNYVGDGNAKGDSRILLG